MTSHGEQVHVNGKWLAQELTGTQRYANEIVRAIVTADCFDLVIHVPADARIPEWAHRQRVTIRRAPVRGIVFEQLYLPVVTAGKVMVNLAGPAPLLKRRQLVAMHDATPFRYPRTFRRAFVALYFVMYTLLGRTAEGLLTVSRFSADELTRVLRIPAGRFIIAGCAADSLIATEPSRPALDTGGDHYLVVGTQAHHKNLTAPVIAVAESGRNIVVVGIAGNDQVYSATSSLEGHAVVAGRLTDAELVWVYRNTRALIFPSKYEGFGLPPLEAQALGCPVVCSTAASLPEVCGDGALYFDPDDPKTLLAQLDRLESEPDLADRLRCRGAANAQQYSWHASAKKVIDWLAATLQTTART
jgi:glycosyltransferase involved in cell wall biosynthesis